MLDWKFGSKREEKISVACAFLSSENYLIIYLRKVSHSLNVEISLHRRNIQRILLQPIYLEAYSSHVRLQLSSTIQYSNKRQIEGDLYRSYERLSGIMTKRAREGHKCYSFRKIHFPRLTATFPGNNRFNCNQKHVTRTGKLSYGSRYIPKYLCNV